MLASLTNLPFRPIQASSVVLATDSNCLRSLEQDKIYSKELKDSFELPMHPMAGIESVTEDSAAFSNKYKGLMILIVSKVRNKSSIAHTTTIVATTLTEFRIYSAQVMLINAVQ